VWGLLLGAPLVAIAKVAFDRVESLKPAGELLGRQLDRNPPRFPASEE
jgi:predicted PurR-regulated permease PerM